MSNFCYEKCYNIIQKVYHFFMFFSLRTKPELHETQRDNSKSEYCELCDLDDFRLETDLESK